MKIHRIVCALLALLGPGAFAVPSDIIYTEGRANVRYRTGSVDEAMIGDRLNTGDTVTTGFDGFVELDRAGLALRINPDTVFTLQEREQAGETTGVFSVVLGSIKFRYGRITGKEPLIQTGSAIAGVRGTEFTVYAGADGSSLILVDSGEVTVEAAGRAVELAAEEGVEVRPGEPPGDKFKVQRDQIDYRSWNEAKIEAMLEDPLSALERIAERMEYYVRSVEEYLALYNEHRSRLESERKNRNEIYQRDGEAAARRYENEVVFPLTVQTGNIVLNTRYFSLTALSLRRYVAGRLFVFHKARSLAPPRNLQHEQFTRRYSELLNRFEQSITPQLVAADI